MCWTRQYDTAMSFRMNKADEILYKTKATVFQWLCLYA